MKSVKNKKLIIGITGPIGSGKSTLLNYLKEKGYKVVSADQINYQLLNETKHIVNVNKLLFNTKSSILDKKLVKEVIFKDSNKKTLLENYLHPLIIKTINKELKKGANLMFVEAALLYESGFNKQMDYVIGVVADSEVIVKRLKKRDNLDEEMIKNILATQKSKEFLKENANYLVDNSYSIENTYQKLDEILKMLMEAQNGNLQNK